MKMLRSRPAFSTKNDFSQEYTLSQTRSLASKHIFFAANLNHHHFDRSVKLAQKRGDLTNKSLHITFKRLDPSILSRSSFKILTRSITRCHNLSSLDFSLLTHVSSRMQHKKLIFSALKNLLRANPRLRKLSLDLYNIDFSNYEAFLLKEGLLRLAMLECLTFFVKQLPEFDIHVSQLAKSFRAMSNIRSLKAHVGKKDEEAGAELLVYTLPSLGSSLLEKLASFMPSLTKLEEFHFYASRELEDRAIENLLFALPELKHLKSFYYEPYATKFTMLQMLEPLSDMGSLKSFGFNFSTVEDDATTEELTYFKMLTNLKELKATFKSVPALKVMSLISLLKTAASFESLETLVLEFEFNEEILGYLDEENDIDILDTLFNSLSRSLKRLKLTISNTCNKGLELVSNALHNLPNLKFLSITLKKCRLLNDKPFNSFAESFSSFKDMEHFYLGIHTCPHVTDNAMIPLQENLGYMTNLKWAGFSFIGCIRITGKSFGYLKGAFPKLDYLETLDLEYQSCKNVSDGLFKHLKGLYDLKILNTLSLTIKKCPKVTEQGMILLGEIIRDLRNLKELYFKPGMDVAKNLLSTFLSRVDLIASLYNEEEPTPIQVE